MNIRSRTAGAKKMLSLRSSIKSVPLTHNVLIAFLCINLTKSFAYGLDMILSSSNPASALMAFPDILGLAFWGMLILIAAFILLIGLLTKNVVLQVIGLLLCVAVWAAYASTLVLGYLVVSLGFRVLISALATGAVWVVFFVLYLKAIRSKGV